MSRVVSFAVVFAFIAISAFAQPRLDQEQVNIRTPENTVLNGSTDQRLAQTFTVTDDGYLSHLTLPLSCQPASKVLVRIEKVTAGVPSGSVLQEVVVPGSFFTSYPTPAVGFRIVEFDRSLHLSSGEPYAFTLEAFYGDCAVWIGPAGSSYGGGRAFFATSDAPAWHELFFMPGVFHDLAFQVFLVD